MPRGKLPEMMRFIRTVSERHDLRIPNVFHAGDGNIHPILMCDEEDPQNVQKVRLASQEILEYCIDVGGTITGEHGVGGEKLHLMEKMFNPATIDTFKRIKITFDPDRRINDAKKIPSDKTFVELLKPIAANVPGGAM